MDLNQLTNCSNGESEKFLFKLTPAEKRSRHKNIVKKALRGNAPSRPDSVEPVIVDGFEINREYWAKAFKEWDICKAAWVLFEALFTMEEIRSCTLHGRGGTTELSLVKRNAIFRAVGWMKNKHQNPYSFDVSNISDLEPEEKTLINRKIFVEKRCQTARRQIGQKNFAEVQNKARGLLLKATVVNNKDPSDLGNHKNDKIEPKVELKLEGNCGNTKNIQWKVDDAIFKGKDGQDLRTVNYAELNLDHVKRNKVDLIDEGMNPPRPKLSKVSR